MSPRKYRFFLDNPPFLYYTVETGALSSFLHLRWTALVSVCTLNCAPWVTHGWHIWPNRSTTPTLVFCLIILLSSLARTSSFWHSSPHPKRVRELTRNTFWNTILVGKEIPFVRIRTTQILLSVLLLLLIHLESLTHLAGLPSHLPLLERFSELRFQGTLPRPRQHPVYK